MTLGTVAVDIFFVTSGFLVTSSLMQRGSFTEFVWARILRIYPALVVMLGLTVFGVGIFFTELPVSRYLRDPSTLIYFFRNAVLVEGVEYNLPGVFQHNLYVGAVNGSLWTMPFEIKMYIILALSWLVLRVTQEFRPGLFRILVFLFTVIYGVLTLAEHFHPIYLTFPPQLFFMFFTGASYYLLKDMIVLSRNFFMILVLLLAASLIRKNIFFIVYNFSFAYLLFYLAYVPSGAIRLFNKCGDYSYGVYIYAFPVQQTIAALVPGISIRAMILFSGFVTLLCAVLSWHLVEKRTLALKSRSIDFTRRFLRKTSGCNPLF